MDQPSALCVSGTHHVKSYAESRVLEEVMCGSDATKSRSPLSVHIQLSPPVLTVISPLGMIVFTGDC